MREGGKEIGREGEREKREKREKEERESNDGEKSLRRRGFTFDN